VNLAAGTYILAWLLIWSGLMKVVELTWRGSAVSQALGFFTG